MAIDIEAIRKEAGKLPRRERFELVRLLLDLDQHGMSDDVETPWDKEIRARVNAVDEGRAAGIPVCGASG